MALQTRVTELKRQIDNSNFSAEQKQAMMWSVINSLYNQNQPDKMNSYIDVMQSLNEASGRSESGTGIHTR